MSKRDDFNIPTKKLLAERVAYRCSNPDCRKITIGPNANENKSTTIGVAAHICAAAKGGPRYDDSMTIAERTGYTNGIWLCSNCATIIDKDPQKYSINLLKVWKNTSEEITDAEINDNRGNSGIEDKSIIQFYLICLDRPAFNDDIRCEGSIENLQQAIADTLIAINTGVLFDRSGRVLKQSNPKSCISNPLIKDKILLVCDLLQALLRELELGLKQNTFYQNENGFYCFQSREYEEWFNYTRQKILHIMAEICVNLNLSTPHQLRKNMWRRFLKLNFSNNLRSN